MQAPSTSANPIFEEFKRIDGVDMLKLHELEGSAFEDAFMAEINNFKDAMKGVNGDDVAAALILKDEGRTDLLEKLHQREIHVVGEVDEDTKFKDLVFE
jgi:hypothetical protein